MERKRRGFDDKLLSKIAKIDRHHLRDYILQLLSQKQFFETIFEHLSEGVVVTDGELQILYSNPIARLMLQWPPNKLFTGEDFVDHCPPGELKSLLVSMRRQPRRLEQYECMIGQEGSRRITITSIGIEALGEAESEENEEQKDEAAEPMWVFLLRDVTEHYRSIEEHSRAQRLASLALLTSGVAHEIKNPLNSLNIHAQILLKEAEAGPDAKKVKRAAEVIQEETDRLTQIVNEFIQATRPHRPVIERQSLDRVFADLQRIFAPECEQAGINIKFEMDSDLPAFDMDAHLMFQALRNLIKNAIEALQSQSKPADAEEPERPKIILVRARLAGDHVKIEVADNGPGIPEENIDKIFEPYYTTKFNGTGLGLMIVYRIVAEHRGSIHVESHAGMGSRFMISIPIAEKPVRYLEEPAEAPAPSAV